MLELDGEVHGKPADAVEAAARWRRMRGGTGVLHTGHWLVDLRDADAGGTGGMVGGTASTTVHFADLDDAEIDAYVATGEPLRVAGAFTLDGLGGPYVSGIEGDPTTSSASRSRCCASWCVSSASPGTTCAPPPATPDPLISREVRSSSRSHGRIRS